MPKIVVMGGSVGAIGVLEKIFSDLPSNFPAAILIVTHTGAQRSMLTEMLSRNATIPISHANDDEMVVAGRILLAPANEHLTVVRIGAQVRVRLSCGPKENHCRPAIDPLFRSAALAFGSDAIGVLLSGYLDDGTIGLQAIKSCGGSIIVQHPDDAAVSEMPAAALKYVAADRILRTNEIVPTLLEMLNMPVSSPSHALPTSTWPDVHDCSTADGNGFSDMERLGKPSSMTCPECSGALWEVSGGGPLRYRCHTGHALTARVLEFLQGNVVEDAIWGAIRALNEQERLLEKLCERDVQAGHKSSAAGYQARAMQARVHSRSLRDVIAARSPIVKPGPD